LKGFHPDPNATKPTPDLAARRAYLELRRRILDGEIAQGEIVNEVAMAANLNVSRTPLREALRELLNEGLLDGDGPRRQVRVREMTPKLIDEAFASRTALEAMVASEAAQIATAEDIDTLRLIVARLGDAARAGDTRRFLEIDDEFHAAMSTVAGATVTEDFLRRLRALIRISLVREAPTRRALRLAHSCRVGVVDAMSTHRAEDAVLASAACLRASATWLDSPK
jgi:DNA-binding GntR family transcriptional regulator